MDRELHIDKEFQMLIRPLSKKEYKQLEANLLEEGCLDPIIVWGDIILDGQHRYTICRKHHLPFEIKEKDFESREEAIVWICAHQLGRRNLSEEAMKFLIGIQCEKEKVVAKRRNEAGTNQYTPAEKRKESSQRPMIATTTAQRIAEEQHLSPSTVVKYGQYRVIRLCIGTWEGEANSFSANMLNAICLLVVVYGDLLNEQTFKEKVGAISVKQICRIAKDRRPGSLGVAEVMVIEYNGKKRIGQADSA